MNQSATARLEIFLALALQSAAPMIAENADEIQENDDAATEVFPAITDYLNESEREKFRLLHVKYRQMSEIERAEWRTATLKQIGADEPFIDRTVHWTYVGEALRRETAAVRELVFGALPADLRNAVNETNIAVADVGQASVNALAKRVRRAFAAQFVHRNDLPNPTAFDYLNGTQLVRLIRLSGIHEVALACLQIEAVELVAAFLRRFSAEDAQAIAAQLKGLPPASAARIAFAENLVQTMIELEVSPSAMLDLIGIRLIGIALASSIAPRVAYTNQKLPLEVAAQLPEIIRALPPTAPETSTEISQEIEHTARTIYRSTNANKIQQSPN